MNASGNKMDATLLFKCFKSDVTNLLSGYIQLCTFILEISLNVVLGKLYMFCLGSDCNLIFHVVKVKW